MEYSVNMREVTYALSEALDFVGIDDTMHGKRVAYMAAELAKHLSWDKETIDDIIFIGMLHDCGVSSTDVHSHLVNELDWENSQLHSIRGEDLLNRTSFYNEYAPYIRYHHTHWEELPAEMHQKIKEISNLIYLTDRVDALRAQNADMGEKTVPNIYKTIQTYSGTMFSPELVEVFLNISTRDSFWFYLEEEALNDYLTEWVAQGKSRSFPFATLKEIALMFAAVVDAKSSFTSEHSLGVATLSKFLAQKFELPVSSCEKVELAGLLHDLGKLRIDDAILDKPSKLNAAEKLKMNRHGFDSDIILRRIKGFKEIAHIASLHHETLDAKGYPYHLSASEIPFEARIIAVADIFQALVQNRPYRDGLTQKEAYTIINEMCEDGKLDIKVVAMLQKHLEESYNQATVKYDILQNTVI